MRNGAFRPGCYVWASTSATSSSFESAPAMSCDLIYSSLNRLAACVETTEARLATHCLYPSFDPVHVFVAKVGEGFKVHDGSGAFRAAWLHGRDDLLIKRAIDAECKRFHAKRVEEAIAIEIESEDWLPSAILSVANASSLAAHTAVARITAAAETVLVDEIHSVASALFGLSNVDKEVDLRGKSGGKRRYDVVNFIVAASTFCSLTACCLITTPFRASTSLSPIIPTFHVKIGSRFMTES